MDLQLSSVVVELSKVFGVVDCLNPFARVVPVDSPLLGFNRSNDLE